MGTGLAAILACDSGQFRVLVIKLVNLPARTLVKINPYLTELLLDGEKGKILTARELIQLLYELDDKLVPPGSTLDVARAFKVVLVLRYDVVMWGHMSFRWRYGGESNPDYVLELHAS